MNCPNCLSPHPDDSTERDASLGSRPLNHRKRSRLHSLTKVLFSPARVSLSGNTSKEFVCCPTKNITNQRPSTDNTAARWPGVYSKYSLERKHKVKKRDLVQQYHPCETEQSGNIPTYVYRYVAVCVCVWLYFSSKFNIFILFLISI